jgi:xanthine dehydrogenase large subunit
MNTAGKPKSHESAPGHVSGAAIYTDDQRPPVGMLWLYPVLSSQARAKILAIDVEAAQSINGVVTVLTAADVPGENDTGVILHDEPLFPVDEVSYWGQPIVWVVGETEAAARQGAEKVRIDYQPLEPILQIKAAIAANSFHNDPQVCLRGEPAAVLAEADLAIVGEIDLNGQDHFRRQLSGLFLDPTPHGNPNYCGAGVGSAQQSCRGHLFTHGRRLWGQGVSSQSPSGSGSLSHA